MMPATTFSTEFFFALLPAAILALGAVAIGVVFLLAKRAGYGLYRWIAAATSVVAVLSLLAEAYRTRKTATAFVATPGTSHLASGELVVDRFSLFAGVVLCLIALFSVLLGEGTMRRFVPRAAAYNAIVLVACAFGYLLASQHTLGMTSVCLIGLVVCVIGLGSIAKTSAPAVAATWDGFVSVAVALAFVVYGLALLYGLSGSADLFTVPATFVAHPLTAAVALGIAFLGLASLLGGLPFSRWLRDFLATAPPVIGATIFALTLTSVGAFALRFVASWHSDVWWARAFVAALLLLAALYNAAAALRRQSVRWVVAHTVVGQAAVILSALTALGPGIDGHPAQGATAVLAEICVLVAATFGVAIVSAEEDAAAGDQAWRGLIHHNALLGGVALASVAALAALPPTGLFVTHVVSWEAEYTAGFGWVATAAVIATLLLSLAPLRVCAELLRGTGEHHRAHIAHSRLGPAAAAAAVICAAIPFLAIILLQPLMLLAHNAQTALP